MNLLGYGLIVLGVILLGMGLLSRKWGQRTWLRQFITGIILIIAGIYLLLYPTA
jgi:succinate dehydrogenase hydrophobic anchor subunit